MDLPILLERGSATGENGDDGGEIGHKDKGKPDSHPHSHVCNTSTGRG